MATLDNGNSLPHQTQRVYDAIHRRTLTEQELRLLTILPSKDPEAPLECTVTEVERGKEPPYQALSYVWGDVNAKTDIICNGQLFTITQNLSDALEQLRRPNTPRTLWVDSICIDQHNDLEKSSQVRCMGSVYSTATEVVVYLGKTAALSSQAGHAVQMIADACREYESSSGVDLKHPLNGHFYASAAVSKANLRSISWAALRELFLQPWFTRVWCIQEICLASSAVMIWGTSEFNWPDVGMTALWITWHNHLVAESRDLIDMSFDQYRNVTKIYQCTLNIRYPRNDTAATLHRFRPWKATDPRDKVYGLLGLPNLESWTSSIPIDYTKSMEEVYADTLIVQILKEGKFTALDLIHHETDYTGDDGLRSWNPGWDSEVMRVRPMRSFAYKWASGSTRATFPEDEQPNYSCITLRGLFIGYIQHEVESLEPSGLDFFRKTLLDKLKHLGPRSDEYAAAIWSFADSLAAGRCSRDDGADVPAHSLTEGEKQDYVYDALKFAAVERLFKPNVLVSSYIRHSPRVWDLERRRVIIGTGRCFFTTVNGYFGLGPDCMRTGDVAVILFGGQFPYILRPKNDGTYLFLGQAYISNIMDGELIQKMEAGSLETQDFRLV